MPPRATNWCMLCGQQLVAGDGLCAYHNLEREDGWAAVNRIMCDFFHRGFVPPRLSAVERGDDLSRSTAEAA